ncbi:MAG: IgGFc-binding protein [Candidatus Kapabacteria bacterium]|nr:IgGFc-binding protein [Ignavibacteriota bacterium]MCW5883832.1 IgGFc-binding protein [Candidatus Kapabacteria bacterium]
MIRLRIFIFSLLLLIPIFLKSQNPDNIGKEFIVCFPKNDDGESIGAILQLLIINYENQETQLSINFSYDDTLLNDNINPLGSKIIKIDSKYELATINGIERNSIRIKSNTDISVLMLSKTRESADACLLLPISSISNSYVIANISNRDEFNLARINIVAITNNTLVEINSDVRIYNSHVDLGLKKTLNLDEGEVYVLVANIKDNSDFSGTHITSNNPISIFSSHDRTSLPTHIGTQDHIIEQVPPINILGNETIFTLTKFPLFNSNIYSKIVAAFDSTTITWMNNDTVISKGEFLILNSNKPFYIKSDKSVLFSQFEQSAKIPLTKGDPFLAFIPPIQQWKNNYKFFSPELEDFTEHWINIAIHKNSLNSIILDGQIIDTGNFTNVEGTEYYSGYVEVKKGLHSIEADSNFSLLVYGYGIIISYGYTGGMKTERLLEKIMDSNPPELQSKIHCDAEIVITELNEYDSGIESIKLVEQDNLTVDIPVFEKGAFKAVINMKLIDENLDGFAILKSRDVKGHERLDTMRLFGFDLSHHFAGYFDTLFYSEFRCDSIKLSNRSLSKRTFHLYFEKNTEISVPPSYATITLEPTRDTIVPFCVYADFMGSTSDNLILLDDCNRKYRIPVSYTIADFPSDINTKCEVTLEFTIVSDLRSIAANNDFGQNIIMKVFNLSGRELYSGTPNDISNNFIRGVYFVLFIDNNSITKRMMVRID